MSAEVLLLERLRDGDLLVWGLLVGSLLVGRLLAARLLTERLLTGLPLGEPSYSIHPRMRRLSFPGFSPLLSFRR